MRPRWMSSFKLDMTVLRAEGTIATIEVSYASFLHRSRRVLRAALVWGRILLDNSSR